MLAKVVLGSITLSAILGLGIGSGLLQAQSDPKSPAKPGTQCPTCSCQGSAAPVARQASTRDAAASLEGCPHLTKMLGAEGAAAVIKAVRLGLVSPTAQTGTCPGMPGKGGCSVKAAAKGAGKPAGSLQPVRTAAIPAAEMRETATCACGKECGPVGFAVIRSGKTHFFCNEGCRDAFVKKSASPGQAKGACSSTPKCAEAKAAGSCGTHKGSTQKM